MFLLNGVFAINAQEKKNLELADIYERPTFATKRVVGMNPMKDGNTYATLEKGKLNIYNYKTGKKVNTLFDMRELILPGDSVATPLYSTYTLSDDESKVLFMNNYNPIYRHSYTADFYVYDINNKVLSPLSENGSQRLATFSPDATKVAFMRDNNLFIKDLKTNEELQFTHDGKWNHIINGAPDWVYEEEFGFAQGFYWSPDSKKIAFYRFDESDVKEYNMQMFNGLYPEDYKFKYPKAGEDNSIVEIFVYDLETGNTTKMNTGEETDIYFPRIKWTEDANVLAIQRLNRHQNHLEILAADATTGQTTVFYDETNPYYIDVTDNWTFLEDGKRFLMTSEKDGYNHIYLYMMDGTPVKQLTSGDWEVTQVYGFDGKEVYFQAAKNSSVERQIYAVNLKGEMRTLINKVGVNNARFSSNFKYLININSTVDQPYQYVLFDNKGKQVRVLEDNQEFAERMKEYNLAKKELVTITDPAFVLPDGTQLEMETWRILPPDFDPNKKYPVLIYVYGGPGHQTVMNSWNHSDYDWMQILAQNGIICVSINNRGGGARGQEFKKMTYQQLGKYETEDMITLAKYMASQPYVNPEKIAIYGWSYGGFMATSGITKGADYISTAVAVAPVTNWRYYDNIYTERFMRTPQENPSGYDDNSPINFVENLKGNYLLCHGSGDDNVHYQNAMELIKALVSEGKQFDLMVYPNKNHSIYGQYEQDGLDVRMHLFEKINNFLFENLLEK
ncbi:MAG: S9 family peptidase [Bacteroidales bacterium]|nr:S9 family peptidase [Bacteroidales bacterium]